MHGSPSRALHIFGDKNLFLIVEYDFSRDRLLDTMKYKSWNYNLISPKVLMNHLAMNTLWQMNHPRRKLMPGPPRLPSTTKQRGTLPIATWLCNEDLGLGEVRQP